MPPYTRLALLIALLSHFREDTFPPLFIHLLASSHHSAEHETADKNKGDGQDGAVKETIETKGPRAGHDDGDTR